MTGPSGLMHWLSILFGGIGVVLIAVCIWLLAEMQGFRATALQAEGVVTRIEWSPRGLGEKPATAYAFVQFQDGDRTVEVRSRIGSSPPAFSVGEKVTVMYQPGQADQAVIESFWEQYFLPILLGGLGIVFGAVGGVLFLIPALGRRRRRLALTLGTPVQARVIEVRVHRSMSMNGKHPWVIVAEYRDDTQDRNLAFTSHALWINPEPYYAVGSAVTVYYLPEKPSTYAFDLDRLPEAV